ncbi:hypothetical protein [Promicromonospora sukumoe]|uniref:Uncharacterized protein n=1 Tax=Promicromonospora sukumoe TaxID=88382 RepID=A0A7W3J7H7_9MICO|nr:hypothetical protein [Promicromonospora sukumoe]MBA8807668.1 hypothetical protein [Promicromonospora sukumoe]
MEAVHRVSHPSSQRIGDRALADGTDLDAPVWQHAAPVALDVHNGVVSGGRVLLTSHAESSKDVPTRRAGVVKRWSGRSNQVIVELFDFSPDAIA